MPRKGKAPARRGIYRHKRLCYKRNEIRLIKLKPATAIRDVVQCDIITVSLEHAPRFEAISYAWGDTSNLWPIAVNGSLRMLVSKSLETALRYLRHRDKERLLWADAICINQKYIPEKNRVVSEMHLIYRRADVVIVWLGCPCRPWSFQPVLDAINEDESNNDERFTWRCQVLTKPHRSARAIQGFARLQWFFRGWVVQETCFAREIIGQYGRHTIPWHKIENLVARLSITASGTMSGFMRPEGRLLLKLMKIVSTLKDVREKHHKSRSMDLGPMISFSRRRMTSDPRDKIFAFVNLLSIVPASLQPDYNKSTSGLFREVARLLLEDIGLSLLAECEANTSSSPGVRHGCLPSWIPDWSYARRCEPLPGGLSHSSLGDSYCAGLNLVPNFKYSAASAVLVATGLIFDVIVYLEPRGPNLLSDGAFVNILWEQVTSKCGDAAAGTPFKAFASDFAVFKNHLVRMEHLDRTLEGKRSTDPEELHLARWTGNLQRVDGRIALFTSRGYMGWAPPATELGDVIVVLAGCHVPLVVRKVHVDGLADPNLVSTHDTRGCSWSTCKGQQSTFYRVIGEACKFISSSSY
jgi:Heterokaryon incompatibility protein (HET)